LKNRQIFKGTKMSKPTGLTSLAITSKKEDLAAAKAVVVALRKEVADLRRARKDARINLRAEKIAAKELKAIDRAEKKAARIAKLEAKLIAMKSPPVGRLAIKAAKKPSKVTVTKMAA
jgi:hypothetical protein